MKRIISIVLCIVLAFSVLTACGRISEPAPTEIVTPENYSEIYRTLRSVAESRDDIYIYNASVKGVDEAVEEAAPTAAADHSETNVQVKGVDEADVVKTDGEYIYRLSGGELRIYSASGADSGLVSSLTVCPEDDGKYANAIYLCGDKLVVIGGEEQYRLFVDYAESSAVNGENDKSKSFAMIYDVSDPAAPQLVKTLGQDGWYSDSRLIGSTLYMVSSYWVAQDGMVRNDPSTFVPETYCDGESTVVSSGCIEILPEVETDSYTVICAYDVGSGQLVDTNSILGSLGMMYMTQKSIYFAESVYEEIASEPYREDNYTVVDYASSHSTAIRRIDLASGLTISAEGSVPGYIESQFSMDEYEDTLRIVTTENKYDYKVYTDEKHGFENYVGSDGNKDTNGLYILDGALGIIGSIDGLAETEQVRSVRFDESFVYFCTFRQVDPLFAVDLSDPADPKILSELKISGFSEYLHPWSEDLLLGLGNEADTETGAVSGLKLVMFDISDKSDVNARHTLVLSDAGYSEALYDHKAILAAPDKGLIGFSCDNSYRFFVYDSESGFSPAATVDLGDEWSYGARGLYVGGFAYVLSDSGMKVLDLASFDVVKTA